MLLCKIFECSRRSLMRWVKQYKRNGNTEIIYNNVL